MIQNLLFKLVFQRKTVDHNNYMTENGAQLASYTKKVLKGKTT